MRLLDVFLFTLFNLSAALYTAVPRWAQAVVVINDALFLYGGKTDQYNAFGYNSAPWNNDLLFLSLSTAFDPSVPPWQIPPSPRKALRSPGTHSPRSTIPMRSSLAATPGPLSAVTILDNDDSAQLLNVLDRIQPIFIPLPEGWAGEPQRRMRHATASINGSIYIIGGEAADDSGNLFSTHYLFIPSIPLFIELPSENAPPGIIGHAAIILPDGRLLVFGGISQGQLVPFDVCWVLDTTQSNLMWTRASIDQSTLPNPRSSFAVVLLDDGRILIQGGTDAAFQSTLDDGWILDPSRSPMAWTPVPALSQLGPRKDHFAINAGGQVVFGLGYGSSAPADAALHVYDVGAASFQPTFSPVTAPPAHTTLPPDPSQTITNGPGGTVTFPNGQPPGHSGTGVSGSNTGPSTRHPTSSTSTSTSGGGDNGQGNGNGINSGKSHTAAIAVGSVLGAVGLATCAVLTVWYLHRRHARSNPSFSPLDDDDEEHPHSITAVPIAGTHEKGPRILAVPLGLLSMTRTAASTGKFSVVEDLRAARVWSILAPAAVPTGGRTLLLQSLRNLARSTGRASHSRESSTAIDWEKRGVDPFSPEVALMAGGLERNELPERTGPSQPYENPFAHRDSSSEVLYDYLSGPEPEPHEDPQEARPSALRTLTPRVDFVPLSPLIEQASQNSLSNSSSSHNASSEQNVGSGSSNGNLSRSPRPSSILDPNPPPSEPIRRSNSWWARFAKTPLLERRNTGSSTRDPSGFIDFRDPNPPPRLLTIEESTHSHSPDVSESRRMGSVGISAARSQTRRRPSLYHETSHGRSASSLQTANTDTLERMGGTMDIVQRDATLDSRFTTVTSPFADDEFGVAGGPGQSTSPPSSFGSSPLQALFVRGQPSYSSARTESSSELPPSPPSTPPTSTSPHEQSGDPTSGEPPAVAHPRVPPAGGGPQSPGVSERVRAFERRMSRDGEVPPPPTNTRRREERTTPRPVVRYGLVPRASLFVANPDGGPEREPRV
ncbi:hypothetical protein EDB92DRAFT_2104049 [Lactarius akahatsu]|uniref:Galactose oxidase n=1 Tax=Lactarius akahatsu TaxID=416441 RepID=A0AAD4LDV0_9AGAM|nr:hypothetical protein EDB92DRAFT_2104049 [Lactarius akahatsu]